MNANARYCYLLPIFLLYTIFLFSLIADPPTRPHHWFMVCSNPILFYHRPGISKRASQLGVCSELDFHMHPPKLIIFTRAQNSRGHNHNWTIRLFVSPFFRTPIFRTVWLLFHLERRFVSQEQKVVMLPRKGEPTDTGGRVHGELKDKDTFIIFS